MVILTAQTATGVVAWPTDWPKRCNRSATTPCAFVAAPRFLGLLRLELGKAVGATVVEEIDKDLVHASDDELARRLPIRKGRPSGDKDGYP